MKPRSLARQAIVAVLVVESLCALAFSGTALWHERRTRLRAFDVMLQGRSDSLLGAVQDAEDPNDNVTIDPTELKLPADEVYAVYNEGGRLLGTSPDAPPVLIERAGDSLRSVRSGGKSYRVLQREALRIIDRAENSGVGLRRPVTILYAAPMTHMWHEIFEAAGFYMLVSLLLVCTTTALLILLTRRLLRPLEDLALAASAVNTSTLAFTPPVAALCTRELRPLADALGATIARLRQAFHLQHRFVGDAAHELKTAVAVVRSTVQVLALRPRSEEEYRLGLDQVLADTERVETLVSRMLTLARFEEHRDRVDPPVNLSAATDRALGVLTSFARAHGVSLNASLEAGCAVRLSPEAVETLLSNLVVNAVQHSPPGAEVRAVLRLDAGRTHALLDVVDSGEGIAEESLPHVFERFFREDRSRSRQTGGAGLGLAICKGIVEAANGSIEIRSVEGRGTTVSVSFPLVPANSVNDLLCHEGSAESLNESSASIA